MKAGHLLAAGVVAIAVAVGLPPAQARPGVIAASPVVVSESGEITGVTGHTLHLGRSAVTDVTRAEGGAADEDMGIMGRKGPAGRMLTYRFGTGKSACTREYGFAAGASRLASFESNCRDTQTATGTKFGMTPAQIQGHQHAFGDYSPPLGHDCTFNASGVATEHGSTWLVVWTKGVSGKGKLHTPDMVKSIGIYAANAPIWAAACM